MGPKIWVYSIREIAKKQDLSYYQNMTILSIDTSCDDTSIAVLKKEKGKIKVLSNIVSSQVKLHQKYGGVYPSLAKREHQKNLALVLKQALIEAKLLKKGKERKKDISLILKREPVLLKKITLFLKTYQKPKIDALAVTIGPGLEPCLWVGINFAKALSSYWNLKIIPVNHIEAHILINFLNRKIKLPSVALIVSGGHTQLVLIKKIGKYRVIGETRDDAAGECFDKTARIIGLPYPGGPAISKLAKKETRETVSLPRPMLKTNNFDFSFSGLKTAVLYQTRNHKLTRDYKIAMAKEIEEAIVDVLVKKTKKAAQKYKAETIIIGGGVAANDKLRKELKAVMPEKKLCTDNAVMIGVSAFFNLKYKKDIKAEANLRL